MDNVVIDDNKNNDKMDINVILPLVLSSIVVLSFIYYLLFSNKSVPLMKVPLTPDERSTETYLRKQPDKNAQMILSDPNRPGKLQCYDPSTMEHIGEVDDMNAEQVEAVIMKAKNAQKQWAKTSFEERRQVMRYLLKYFVEEAETIANISVRDSGKTLVCAVLGEVVPTAEKLRWIIANGEDILSPSYRGGQGLLTLHKVGRVEYKPLGVIGIAAPFNYPCHNMMNHIISGLFAGNGVVIKVSEFTSWSADYYLRIVRTALKEAGNFNPDIVQVVTGLAPAGVALSTSKNIDKFIFTGSDRIGKIVMGGCAKNLTPVVLELGGKDPFIVCADVDVNHVAPTATRGVFQNSGQNCVGIERLFVERKIYKQFVDKMVEVVKQMRQGVPLKLKGNVDIGAMAMPGQVEICQTLCDDAVKHGAKVLVGGKVNEKLKPGLFFEPTILVDVTPEMRISQEEVFGPIMAIQPFDSEEELFEKANNCQFALGSSVFCNDRTRALRIAENVKAGMCNINDFGVNYLVQSLPFGGVKASGFGRFAGPEGLRACCYEKSITEDYISFIQTSIPAPLAYPVASNSPELARGLVNIAYGDGISGKIKGIISFVSGLISATKPSKSKSD